jgi:hypothetical protein
VDKRRRTVKIRKELSERRVHLLPHFRTEQSCGCRTDCDLSSNLDGVERRAEHAVPEDLAIDVVLDFLDDQRNPEPEVFRR